MIFLVDAPKIESFRDEHNKVESMHCDTKWSNIHILYISVLSMYCLVQAFRARKLPNNFNETKFIVVAMLANLVAYSGTAIILSSLREEKRFEDITFFGGLSGLTSNLSILCITIGYKVWLMIIHPHMNTQAYFQTQMFNRALDSANRGRHGDI